MSGQFRVRLAARNEGITYSDDESGTHLFNVDLNGRTWRVEVPIGKLTDVEEHRILPRIQAFLERVWWLGIFPRTYSVTFVRAPLWPADIHEPRAYKIGFAKRKSAVDYSDIQCAYRFDIRRGDRKWIVHLPPWTRDAIAQRRPLADDERRRIFPRLSQFLSRGPCFGIMLCRYGLEFVEDEQASHR